MQTNRDSAVQIEVVGFAAQPKNQQTLQNVARLCRWLEATHGIPQVWPNGLPKVATPAGGDPGGHNRNAANWDTKGGHYGHSHVPENTHWDPGYTTDEVNFIMEASFDATGALAAAGDLNASYDGLLAKADPAEYTGAAEASTVPQHGSLA